MSINVNVYKFMVTAYLFIFLPLYAIFPWKNNMNMYIGSLSYLAAGITKELWLFDLQWEWGSYMPWTEPLTQTFISFKCVSSPWNPILFFKKKTSKQKNLESSTPTEVRVRLPEYSTSMYWKLIMSQLQIQYFFTSLFVC